MTYTRTLSVQRSAAIAALASATLIASPSSGIKLPEVWKPTTDRDFFPDFQVKDLRASLDDITVRMKNVRAKKNWQRQELELLKQHRRILSGHLNAIENAAVITPELLNNADNAVEDYRNAVS